MQDKISIEMSKLTLTEKAVIIVGVIGDGEKTLLNYIAGKQLIS